MGTITVEKEILNKSIVYFFSLYVRIFTKLLGGIVIAKLLGPTLYGLRNAFGLSLEYEEHSDLGTFSALNRQAPYYRGAKDFQKADDAISSVFGINIVYAFIAAVILIFISRYLGFKGWEQKYVDFFFFLGIIIFSGKLNRFFQFKLKIDKKFYFLSRIEILYGLSATVIGVIFVYFFGFRGLLISLPISDFICIGYMLSKEKRIPPIKISFPLYWDLLKIGFPMMILFLLLMLLRTADRTVILALISEEALGYFGIATIATSIIGTIPMAVHNVTLAPVMEKFGKTKNKHSIKNYFIEPMILMAYTIPVLIAGLYFSIHLPIDYFLAKFHLSIPVVKILIIGFFFQAVASPALSICLAFNKQIKLILLVTPLVALNFCLNIMFIRVGWGIEGVALGTSITFFVYFCVFIYFALTQFEGEIKEFLAILLSVLIPFAYSILLVLFIENIIKLKIFGLWQDIFLTSLKASLFIILYSIIFLRIRKHSAFIKLVDNSPLAHLIPNKWKTHLSTRS